MKVSARKILRIAMGPASLRALLLFSAPVSAGKSAVPQHGVWTEEISGFWVLNQCAGERLVCEGAVHYALHELTEYSGSIHWVLSTNHNLKGAALAGNEYRVANREVWPSNMRGCGRPYERTFVNASPLVSHGEDTDTTFYNRNKLTINANTQVVVSYSETSVDCQGKD